MHQRRTALPLARNTASNELQRAAPADGPELAEQPFRRASERSGDGAREKGAGGAAAEVLAGSQVIKNPEQGSPEDRLADEFEQDFHDLEMDQDIDENVRQPMHNSPSGFRTQKFQQDRQMEPNRSVINLYAGRINKDQMPLPYKPSGPKVKEK